MPNGRTKEAPENSLIGGFVRGRADTHTAGQGLTVELTRPDELAQAALAPPAAALPKGPGQKRGRRLKLAVLGIPSEMLDRGDPRYASALRTAAAYRKHRARELCQVHGHVSAGVSSLLATASINLAASRFLYEKFAQDQDLNYLKLAAKLSDSARQNELAAWEMCAREGTARKKMAAADAGLPWLAVQDGGQKKTGRKRREELQAAEAEENVDEAILPLPEFGGDLSSWASATAYASAQKETDHGVDGNGTGEVSVVPGVPGDG